MIKWAVIIHFIQCIMYVMAKGMQPVARSFISCKLEYFACKVLACMPGFE